MKQTYTGDYLHKVIYRLSHRPDHVRITSANAPINSSLSMPHKILRFDNARPKQTGERLRLLEDVTGTRIDSVTCTGQPETTWHPARRNLSFQRQPLSPKNVMDCSGVSLTVKKLPSVVDEIGVNFG